MDRDLVADTAPPCAEIRLERPLCYKSKAVRPYLAGRRPVDLVLTAHGVSSPSLGVECLHQHFARLGCEVPPRHEHDVLVDMGRNAVRMYRVARRRSPRWNGRSSATPDRPFDAGLRVAAVEVIPRSPAWRCASALSPSSRKARPASSPRRLWEGCAARERRAPPRAAPGARRMRQVSQWAQSRKPLLWPSLSSNSRISQSSSQLSASMREASEATFSPMQFSPQDSWKI